PSTNATRLASGSREFPEMSPLPPPPLPNAVLAARAIDALREVQSRVTRDDFTQTPVANLPMGLRPLIRRYSVFVQGQAEVGALASPSHLCLGEAELFLIKYWARLMALIPD